MGAGLTDEHHDWLTRFLGIDTRQGAKPNGENTSDAGVLSKVGDAVKGATSAVSHGASAALHSVEETASKASQLVTGAAAAALVEGKTYVENKVDEARKEVATVKQALTGDNSGKPVPRPMEADCKPEHGKVPGPKNHLHCATHGHVLDTDAKQIIAASVAAYVKNGIAKAVRSVDPSALTNDIGRSGPLNSPSYVNNPNQPATLTDGPTASAGDSYFVTGGQKGELLSRLKGLYAVGNQMNEMAKLLEKNGGRWYGDDKTLLASAKDLAAAGKATLTLASEIDKWAGGENAASITKGSEAVEKASKLIKAVETVSKLRDAHLALEKMEEKPNQQSVEAWADSVGDAFASAGAVIPTSGLPGFMGDYYKGLFNAPKNYISAFKTLMHVHYDNIDTESGLTGETLLRDATQRAEDLGNTKLNWSGDLTPVFMGGWTLPHAKSKPSEFQRYMIEHHKIAGTDLLKTTVKIGVALLSSQIATDLDDGDDAKRAWLDFLSQH